MNLRNSLERYGSVQIALHWAMLLLLSAVYACIELKGFFAKGSDIREALKTWHFMLGLTVLALATIRLVAHLIGPSPRIHPAPPRWQELAGKLMHFALYVFMIGMPIVGWLVLSSEGKAIPFFGLQLPPLMGVNADLTDQLEEVHETVGEIGYFLVGLHAAAALAHHYFLHDDTLRRMLPRRMQSRSR